MVRLGDDHGLWLGSCTPCSEARFERRVRKGKVIHAIALNSILLYCGEAYPGGVSGPDVPGLKASQMANGVDDLRDLAFSEFPATRDRKLT